MKNLTLVTEDELSEAIAKKLVQQVLPSINIDCSLGKQGFGYIKSKMKAWNEISEYKLILVVTDLDNHECAPKMRHEWTKGLKPNSNLLFRIAVREIESWLLADHLSVKKVVKTTAKIPESPDLLNNPKQTLLNLIDKYGYRQFKEDLIRKEGNNCFQGIGYNNVLSAFVESTWSASRAAKRSDSLRRSIDHLQSIDV